MKKIILLILVSLLTFSSSFAINGFKVVLNQTGAAVDVQIKIVNISNSAELYAGPTNNFTPNASGIISVNVPAIPSIDPVNITNSYYVRVLVNTTIHSQRKLNEMIFEQAQAQAAAAEPVGDITVSDGGELKFAEPAADGDHYTSFQSPALAGNVIYTLPIDAGTNGQVLTTNGSAGELSWTTPASGGGGSGTFFLEFSSFNNGSCCNDRSLNTVAPLAAASGIFMNSTQPKPAYGQPFAVDLEVVSVSVYLNLTTKSLTAPVVFNVTPYIVNQSTGATDRALTAAIDLETLAEDQWHSISLSSSTPADNLVDASAGQYVMWELNSTHGGGEFDGEGTITFRVEVKYP